MTCYPSHLYSQSAQTAHKRESEKKSTTKPKGRQIFNETEIRGKEAGGGWRDAEPDRNGHGLFGTRTSNSNLVEPNDVIDTAVAAGQFKTLAAALEAADLIQALKSDGPFTVFAPTDAAFAKLPAGTVETLLKPENKEKLKAILLYHVVPGNVTAEDVMKLNGQSVKTLQGSSIKVMTSHGVRVDNAKVTQTDIKASNGVIHVIDTVLMPKM